MSEDVKVLEQKIKALFAALEDLGWSRALIYDNNNQLIDNFMLVGNEANVNGAIEQLQQRPLEKLINTMTLLLGPEETQRILDVWKKV